MTSITSIKISCDHEYQDSKAPEKTPLHEMPFNVLQLVFKSLGSQANSLQVCKSLDQFVITHVKKALTCATGVENFNFLSSDRFSHLQQLIIEGTPLRPALIFAYAHLSELRWYDCIHLDDYDLLQIAQSKNLKLLHLTNSMNLRGLDLKILLTQLPKLSDLKIRVDHIQGLASLRIDRAFDQLSTLDIAIGKTYPNNPVEGNVYRDEGDFFWLIGKMPNLIALSLKKNYITNDMIEELLIRVSGLEKLVIKGGYVESSYLPSNRSDHKYRLNSHLKLTHLTCRDLLNDMYYSDESANFFFKHLLENSPELVQLDYTTALLLRPDDSNYLIKILPRLMHLAVHIDSADLIRKIKVADQLTHLSLCIWECAEDRYPNEDGRECWGYRPGTAIETIKCLKNLMNLEIKFEFFGDHFGLQFFQSLAENLPNLQYLKLENFHEEDTEVENKLCSCLFQLKTLSLSKVNLKSLKFSNLAAMSPALLDLSLQKCKIDSQDLHRGLLGLTKLKKLHIELEVLDDALMSTNPNLIHLERLSIEGCYSEKINAFRRLIQQASNLKILKLSRWPTQNKGTSEIKAEFFDAILSINSLEEIHFFYDIFSKKSFDGRSVDFASDLIRLKDWSSHLKKNVVPEINDIISSKNFIYESCYRKVFEKGLMICPGDLYSDID